MSVLLTVSLLCLLAVAGFVLCRRRVLIMAQGDTRRLHSLPAYYGWHGALMAFVPALALMTLWQIAQPLVIESRLAGMFPEAMVEDTSVRTLLFADVRRIAAGLDAAVAKGTMTPDAAEELNTTDGNVREQLEASGVALGAEVLPETLAAAQQYRAAAAMAGTVRSVLVLTVAVLCVFLAHRWTNPDFRARNRVERVMLSLLMLASLIAILTTVGIVLSMLSESFRFFSMFPIGDFFLGLTWSPAFQGSSELGFLPLLWGTLYISAISMLVAVPVGLFAAIYLAEFADRRVRSVVKPLIEVIAGIPTVVFGLFALVTVGPALRDWFAMPFGLGNSGSSVMTAGIVIGILNIPFISSLADDIISAVPQSLRDGSAGLGATKAETISQVVLPAALPGVVGAVLMAASRAIGETMIVTMGAGAAAKLDLNPFEAMTTITVKIVSQLTGDTEFNSPETLVAFALGISLFVITLSLNVLAVWIVRKYREQYE